MSKHVFTYSTDWGRTLLQGAPALCQNQLANHVRLNKDVVKQGGFKLPDGSRERVPKPPATERIVPPTSPPRHDEAGALLFGETIVTVAKIDTLSAALAMGDKAAALIFANSDTPGGGYYDGARAQEEDLCRLLPQLIHSLERVQYPIKDGEGECLVTRGIAAVREVSSYQLCPNQGNVNMLTAAMPCREGTPGKEPWNSTVRLRMRGVLHAAKESGFEKLVLGAFGCGAYGNPPSLVAKLFREVLESPEFRGSFSEIVFAIVDLKGEGNLKDFRREISQIGRE